MVQNENFKTLMLMNFHSNSGFPYKLTSFILSLPVHCKSHVSLNDMILQSPDDVEDIDGNKKVSLMEFRQQYRELSQWLTNVQRVAHKSLVSQMLSEKYLAQVSTCRVENKSLMSHIVVKYLCPLEHMAWFIKLTSSVRKIS